MELGLSRDWVGLLREYLEKDLGVEHEYVRQVGLNIFEIDEDCEWLLTIVRQELLPALEIKNNDQLIKAIIHYDICLDHMRDHIKSLRAVFRKLIPVFDKLPNNTVLNK